MNGPYMVEPQKTQIIEAVEHSRIRFSEKIDDEGYYIVYSWGDGPELLEELDIGDIKLIEQQMGRKKKFCRGKGGYAIC